VKEKDRALFNEAIISLGITFETDEQREIAESAFGEMMHMFTVFCRKNKQYGNAFVETGARGTFIEIHAKYARLRSLLWRASDEKIARQMGDIIQNTLDLSVYGVLQCLLVRAGNINGEIPQEDDFNDGIS